MAFTYRVRGRGNFDPDDSKPFRISRSKLDLFLECPKCFYLDQRLGIGRPSTYPLTLNIAVDELLKKEFDILREEKRPHEIMLKYGVDAVPFRHADLDKWRNAMSQGVEFVDEKTNLSVRGGIDDVWINSSGELMVVDYKATSKKDEITLGGDLGAQYKRQMEVYQWLLRKNGFKVSNTGYFVYVNGRKDAEKFDGKLEFDMILLPCAGDPSWIDELLPQIKECLIGDVIPKNNDNCQYCSYRFEAVSADVNNRKKNAKK
ncbi:MAG: PD-(D/E)XK nuclease family protein [Patescibacteria group bacterium]